MRTFSWAVLVLGCASSCGLVDSVDGYAGPPQKKPADAGLAGSVGIGGSAEASTTCDAEEDCDDDNPCTIDSCFGNLCRHDADVSALCDDGNLCNGNETCTTQGECFQGDPPSLSDGDDCTFDTCDSEQGILHQPVDYPDVKACVNAGCPKDYYRAAFLLCDTECGGPNNCGFCINGSMCKRLCKKTHVVCCTETSCAGACPPGYSPGAKTCANACGCGNCGTAITCTRN